MKRMSKKKSNRSTHKSSDSSSDFRHCISKYLFGGPQMEDEFENKSKDNTKMDLKDKEIIAEKVLEDLRLKSLRNKQLISRPLIAPTSEANRKPSEVRQQSFNKDVDPKGCEALRSTSSDLLLNPSTSGALNCTELMFDSTEEEDSDHTDDWDTTSESESENRTVVREKMTKPLIECLKSSNQTLKKSMTSNIMSTMSDDESDQQMDSSPSKLKESESLTSSDWNIGPLTSGTLQLITQSTAQPLEKSIDFIVISSDDESDHQMDTSPSKPKESIACASSDSTKSIPNSGTLQLNSELSVEPLEKSIDSIVISSDEESEHLMNTSSSKSKESESITRASNDSTLNPPTSGALVMSKELGTQSTQSLEKSFTKLVIASHKESDHLLRTSTSQPNELKSTAIDKSEELYSNPVGKLQEICQKNRWPLPRYYTDGDVGPSNQIVFKTSCIVEKLDFIGTGVANNTRSAKRKAAQIMLKAFTNANQVKGVVRPHNSV